MISVEKPGSPSEILEHHGIKGMKWGVRKAVDKTIGTKTAGRKPSSYKKQKPLRPGAQVTLARAQAIQKQRAKEGQGPFGGHGLTPKSVKANIRVQKAGTAAAKAKKAEIKGNRPPQKGIALGRSSREFRAQYPTGKLQAKAIREAQRGVRQRTKAIRKEKDSVEKARLRRDHLNHPGTAVALRTTRGEKVVNALLLGFVPREGIAGDVATISTAATLGTASTRRRIERKQRKGGFR